MGWSDNFISFARDERIILLGIGLASFSIVSTVVAGLTVMRDASAIPPSVPKTRYITQDTEDSLELQTLEKLLQHPGFSVREIAGKILCERAVNNKDVVTHLLYGITRSDYDERMKSLRALALLTGQTTGFEGLAKLNQPKAYYALVRSLELSLDDTEPFPLDDHHWDEYYLRDMAERFCLMLALELINKYGSSMLVKARFIERWLAKQPWGDDAAQRQKNFADYMHFKNNRIVDIVNAIKLSKRGLRALEQAGLIAEDKAKRGIDELPDLLMEWDPATGGEGGLNGQASRPREQSAEEQRLRRQHREAMVLNDGTRPLGRDDIFEPDHDDSPD